jgi:heavy metal sensor kinase
VLAAGLLGGWWLAARAIRPVEQIAATAARISRGKLSERIEMAEGESELGRLAAVLNDTFAKLDAAFAQQVRFTADAAHELRTPVAVVLSDTQHALARERTAPEYRETIEVCQRAARRMEGLIESLLTLAQLGAPTQAMAPTVCDLAEVAREGMEAIRSLAVERKVTIATDLAAAPCVADAGKMSQVVTNLLANAVKYNRDGGEVRVATVANGASVRLTVSDTGLGIAAEHLPHIFERFYRGDPSRNRETGGAGLGLAICKTIADAHGGRITVESEPGAGTTFTVELPRARR